MVDVRCPQCRRFQCAVPAGTPFRGYCKPCKLRWEILVQDDNEPLTAREPVPIMRIGT